MQKHLCDNKAYNDNFTIINTHLTTSISIYHLHISKPDTRCTILYFFSISILVLCSHLQRSQVKCLVCYIFVKILSTAISKHGGSGSWKSKTILVPYT